MNIFKKIVLTPHFIHNRGFDIFIYKVLSKLGVKLEYHSILERTKYYLEKKL